MESLNNSGEREWRQSFQGSASGTDYLNIFGVVGDVMGGVVVNDDWGECCLCCICCHLIPSEKNALGRGVHLCHSRIVTTSIASQQSFDTWL